MRRTGRAVERAGTEHYPGVLAFAVALTGSTAHAQELASEALVRALARRPRRDARDVGGEARAIAAGLYTHDRTRSRLATLTERRLASLDDDARHAATATPPPDPTLAAYATLDPFARACALLRYAEDASQAEIAARLRATPLRVRRALDAAGTALRAALSADPDQERIDVVVSTGGPVGP